MDDYQTRHQRLLVLRFLKAKRLQERRWCEDTVRWGDFRWLGPLSTSCHYYTCGWSCLDLVRLCLAFWFPLVSLRKELNVLRPQLCMLRRREALMYLCLVSHVGNFSGGIHCFQDAFHNCSYYIYILKQHFRMNRPIKSRSAKPR